ncbi:hypothetical protein BVU76_18845 [Mycolicibacterium porcinum]|nr:hypothetical protein BVU76_18845 [Mycolicibacterium porcinum]
MAPSATTNTMAIGSLVASILSLFLFAICGIGLLAGLVGLGLGITALSQIKRNGQPGQGLAIAGIVMGAIGSLIGVGWLLYFVAAMLST